LDLASLVFEVSKALSVLERVAHQSDDPELKRMCGVTFVQLYRAVERVGEIDP
jgi:hypothetical protein